MFYTMHSFNSYLLSLTLFLRSSFYINSKYTLGYNGYRLWTLHTQLVNFDKNILRRQQEKRKRVYHTRQSSL